MAMDSVIFTHLGIATHSVAARLRCWRNGAARVVYACQLTRCDGQAGGATRAGSAGGLISASSRIRRAWGSVAACPNAVTQ